MPFRIFDKAISGYQKQIGLYDREQWECMIEERQLKNFRRIRRLPSKKVGTLVNLVDVDDVRATFHSHVQVQHSWYALTWKGFVRTLFFPLFLPWWRAQVAGLSWWLLILYITQISSTIIFLHYSDQVQQLTFSEAMFPLFLMLVLGVLQNHISCTDNAHRATGRRSHRHAYQDHDQNTVWHDDDVQLPQQSPQPPPQPQPQSYQTNPPSALAMSSTGESISKLPVNSAKLAASIISAKSDNNIRLNGSPNRVEFMFSTDDNRSSHKLASLSINNKVNNCNESSRKEDAADSSADDDKPGTSRRGSVTGGDSRGESDNETDSDLSHSLPTANRLNLQTSGSTGGNHPSAQPFLQYKGGDGDDSGEVAAYSGDCLIEALPEMLVCGVKAETVAGVILTPEQFSSSLEKQGVNGSAFDGNILNLPATVPSTKTLDELESIRRSSQADDSAFSETSGVVRYNEPVSDLLKPSALSKAGNCLCRQPSTSSSGEPLNQGGAPEMSSVDRVCEWRRTASMSNGTSGTLSSGQLRRRKFSGKEKSISQCHDSDVPGIEEPRTTTSETPAQPLLMSPSNEIVTASSPNCKPILRNRVPPRKSSFSEPRAGATSPTSSLDSKRNGVPVPGSLANRGSSSRRRGTGTTTDDTEWDMHTEYPTDSMSSSESECELEQQRENETTAAASLNQAIATTPVIISSVAPNCNQPAEVVNVAPANGQIAGQALNPSTSTDSVPYPGDYGSNMGIHSNQPSNKISCLFWDAEGCKKVEMALNDLGRILIDRVQRSVPPGSEYAYASACFAVVVAVVPLLLRSYQLCQPIVLNAIACDEPVRALAMSISSVNVSAVGTALFSSQRWEAFLILNGIWQRFWLSLVFFFLLCVAENTFKQRVSYAKHFSYLTSAHRARRCDLPHFRLNKVRNIKTWLTLRAYIKRLGPQRPVDIIVSFSFILSVMLLSLLTFLILRDSSAFMTDSMHWELAFWLFVLAVFLLRFMTLGTKINRKYRSLSILITEQINLYLQMEDKPEKKESLLNANSALKLAEELIKELESPFKISGLAANPILYNISKVVLLSAFSAVATELLGFKLKLYKIKIPSS